MKTSICPACGCSLVRLGIEKDKAAVYKYKDEEYLFCCQGCVDIFINDPDKYLAEVADWVVCPACLAEKPPEFTIEYQYGDTKLNFCRCPHCMTEFKKNPDFYIKRLAGEIKSSELFGDNSPSCC
jgi:YHS domain-containing protein